MNYKNAVQELFNKKKQKKGKKTNYEKLLELPKGWILLKKDGNIYENRTQQEIDYDESILEWYRRYDLFITFQKRFIDNTTLELQKQNYSEEEIEIYIENLLYDEEIDESDESNNEDYNSYDENEYDTDESL